MNVKKYICKRCSVGAYAIVERVPIDEIGTIGPVEYYERFVRWRVEPRACSPGFEHDWQDEQGQPV